ncbi:MAG: protein-L-isoaspartate O-methyltransferase [Cucumibacter sp.]
MDSFRRARHAMVDSQLRTNAVTDPRIIEVMGKLPRELFVPESQRALAYIDEDLALSPGPGARFLMQPMPFARLVQLAGIGPDDIVLDIACGTGYSTAVLARLAGSVVAIDDQPRLVEQANENLSALDIGNAAAVAAELAAGKPDEAPFDTILIEGSVEDVPQTLFAQLKQGGRLAVFVRRGPVSSATVFVKSGGEIAARTSFDAAVAPLKPFARKPEFQF